MSEEGELKKQINTDTTINGMIFARYVLEDIDEAKKDLKKRLKDTSQTMLESYMDWSDYWL